MIDTESKDKGPTFASLAVAEIAVDKGFNVRQDFDAEGLDLLGRSLAGDGQDEPVTVNRIDGQYYLIDGERRFRAAVAAGLKTLECKIYEDLPFLEALKKHLRSDIHKKYLNPIDQADGMNRLLECGLSVRQIAEFFGKSEDLVRRRMALLDLPVEIQKMIKRPHHPLPIRQAEMLAGLSNSHALQIARAAAPKTGPAASEEQVKVWVDRIKKGPDLPGAESGPPAGRAERRKKNQQKAKTNPLPQEKSETRTEDEPTRPRAVQAAPNGAADLKPVEVKCGLTGKMKIRPGGQILLDSALLTINAGGGRIQSFRLAELGLEILDSRIVEDVVELLRRAQPAEKK